MAQPVWHWGCRDRMPKPAPAGAGAIYINRRRGLDSPMCIPPSVPRKPVPFHTNHKDSEVRLAETMLIAKTPRVSLIPNLGLSESNVRNWCYLWELITLRRLISRENAAKIILPPYCHSLL